MKLFSEAAIAFGAGVLQHHLTGKTQPLAATITITNRCNLRCQHCGCEFQNTPEMSTDQIKQIIDALRQLGTRKIGITGGEPMLRKDIFELLDHCRESGMITHVDTNATVLNESNIGRLKRLDLLIVSFDGPMDVHRNFRVGTKENVLDKIRLVIDNGIPVCGATTLVTQNLEHIPYIMESSRALGFPVYFSLLNETGAGGPGGADLSKLIPEKIALQAAVDEIVQFKKRGYKVANSYAQLQFTRAYPSPEIPQCYAGKLYVVVDTNGDIYPCWEAMGKMPPLNFFRDGFGEAIRRTVSFDDCRGCSFSCHQELNFVLSLRPEAALNVLRI